MLVRVWCSSRCLCFFLWSHGFSMCSLQISVLFVSMRVEISLFSSGMLGCWWCVFASPVSLSNFVANVLW